MRGIRLTVLLLLASQLFMLTALFYYAPFNVNRLPVIFISVALCLCADAGLLFMYRKIRANRLLEQKLKSIEAQLNIHQKHYEGLADSIAQQKKFQHDYVNQIQAIYTLLNDNCVDEAKAILGNQQDLILQTRHLNYCKNRIVDAVVLNKIRLAETANIKSNVTIDLAEETSFMSIDLCNLFSNILDNAITSCNKENGDNLEHTITLTCGEKGGFLIVKCRNTKGNTVTLTKTRRVQTTKENTHNHGYGLQIVEDIAAKYNGRCAISYDDTYFQIIVYLAVAA